MPLAVVCTEIGPYNDTLQLANVAPLETVPKGTLKLRVACAGLSFPDLLQVEGKYQQKLKPPFVPVAELAGEVLAVGPGVAGYEVGDRVAGWAAAGPDGHQCGGLSEEALVYAARAWKIPGDVSYEVAVTMVRNYGVTHHAITSVMELKEGETVLVLGAAGACGLCAIDLAKAIGARVVACVSSEAKAATCREAGADVVVDYEAAGAEGFVSSLREAKVYGKIDAVFDPVGGRYAEDAFRAMGWGGRFVVFGFASGGTDPKTAFPKFPINLLLMRGQRILGAMGGSPPEKMQEMLGMVQAGSLRPMVSRTYPLRDFARAFEDLATRKSVGKVVVSVAAGSRL